MTARYYVGDVLDVLRSMPDASVDLVLSSPPFLALRSYLPADHPEKAKEIGSEATPGEFIDVLLDVVEECRRVLAPHGSLCFELGDTYSGSGGAGGDYGDEGLRAGQPKFVQSRRSLTTNGDKYANHPPHLQAGGLGWPLAKSLCGIPELFRLSLMYGRNLLTGRETEPWRVRNVIRWCRPNPPVGALADKFRPATSEMVVSCTGRKRYFDLDAVRTLSTTTGGGTSLYKRTPGDDRAERLGQVPNTGSHAAGAPPLDWWEIPTEPYKGSHYACVDEATEALTPSGWRRHDELVDGDLVAAYDLSTDCIRWERAKFVRYMVDTEVVAIEKEQTSQRLTTEHRMLVRSRKRPEPFVKLAADISSGYDLMLSAPWQLPEEPGPGVQMAALLGWFIAEGGRRDKAAVIYQSETVNSTHCDTIRTLLVSVGAKYREQRRERAAGEGFRTKATTEMSWHITGPVADWLRSFTHKQIPAEAVFAWTEDESRALFEALVDGDGSRRADGRIQWVQRDRDCADMFQALALRLGYRAVVKQRAEGVYVVYVGTNRWVTLRGPDGKKAAIPRERYQGVVWCPQVPTTYWLARRDGKPFVTGNTWPTALLVKPILAMCPQRVCTECGIPSERVTQRTGALDPSRPQAARAMELAEQAGLTEEHFAAIRSFGITDAGKALVTQAGAGRNTELVQRLASEAKDVLGGYFREFLLEVPSTTGWTDCGHESWRYGVVLDPFAGSGTTLAVATGHGRDAIGIDLDERNAELARERVGMFLEVVEPQAPLLP